MVVDDSVKNPSMRTHSNSQHRDFHRGRISRHLMTGVAAMSDLVFLILTGAFFALASLIVKGVERL
jgi:hypothetical protein